MPVLPHLTFGGGLPWGPQVSTREAIGIGVAVSGNVLISLALNLQKLAHERLAQQREGTNEGRAWNDNIIREEENAPLLASQPRSPASPGQQQQQREPGVLERGGMRKGYGATAPQRRGMLKRLSSWRIRLKGKRSARTTELPIDIVAPVEPELGGAETPRSGSSESSNGQESDYLKSRLWWFGYVLMNVGELGNFTSYAFAPASVVAPLGTFAIVANCLFAPLLLGEQFRKLDVFGIVIAVMGAVTVVLSSNASDTKLDPHALLKAIAAPAFLAYAIVYTVAGTTLAGLSERSPGGNAGRRTFAWVCVDVGLCAIFGGFTVLSTKSVSTLLADQGLRTFTYWITYPLIVVLAGTGIGQIRYLNRALMRFDSKLVIPTQFVFFNLSAIVGSALLYGDFQKASFHQLVTFLYGCAATFAGVFIIAWTPSQGGDGPTDTNAEEGEDWERPSVPERSVIDPAQVGSLSRRGRATLVVPARTARSLSQRQSVVSLVGISPAQRLLLVHTPPADG